MRFESITPDLLLMIICIGSTFSTEKDGQRIASKVHRRLRNRVLERVEEEPRVDLQHLQTLFLSNYFSRSYGNMRQHEVSQVFHSPSIVMAKLSGIFLAS